MTEEQIKQIKAEIKQCRAKLSSWKLTENYSAINAYKERILDLYEILEGEEDGNKIQTTEG